MAKVHFDVSMSLDGFITGRGWHRHNTTNAPASCALCGSACAWAGGSSAVRAYAACGDLRTVGAIVPWG
jgi:hypothetical protein